MFRLEYSIGVGEGIVVDYFGSLQDGVEMYYSLIQSHWSSLIYVRLVAGDLIVHEAKKGA